MFEIMTNVIIQRTACLLSFAVFLFIFNFLSAQSLWKVEQANVTFSIKNAGITVVGTLSGVEATIVFDSLLPERNSIEATLKTETINTQNQTRDEHLRKDDFFDVKKYPTIKIVSRSFAHKNGSWSGSFALTIKDVTRIIEIPFSYQQNGKQAIWEAEWSIDRTDYGVGNKNLLAKTTMANQVKIKVRLQATAK